MRVRVTVFSCVGVVFMLLACGTTPAPKTTISVGDALAEVQEVLQQNKASDISDSVGTLMGNRPLLNSEHKDDDQFSAKYYELADKTGVVFQFVTRKKDGSTTLSRIVLGEKGKGYGDKVSWSGQAQTNPTTIELVEFK